VSDGVLHVFVEDAVLASAVGDLHHDKVAVSGARAMAPGTRFPIRLASFLVSRLGRGVRFNADTEVGGDGLEPPTSCL
jgi:hypothetical protein